MIHESLDPAQAMSLRSQQKLNLESAILSRIIAPEEGTLSPEAARSILAMGFGQKDLARMNRLASKARSGRLTAAEDDALESYLRVGRFVALVQAKARRSLQRTMRGGVDAE
jgi:hypothetical protein